MTITGTDLFCGAGGSSVGAEAAGMTLLMAANHWQRAIEVHQSHFPNAGHDCADVSQADPRRYPVTDILLASPECTNHSQARGISRKKQDPSLWDSPDPMAERSRATMWDVARFAEQIPYKVIVVENVVEATKWVLFPAWWQAIEALGYKGRILSVNSMHHSVPQSRDRIYIVWMKAGLEKKIDLDITKQAHCTRCGCIVTARQAFKNGNRSGRYRSQWVWTCDTCQHPVEPATRPAFDIIDWSLNCPRIGDRTKPLATATLERILAGMQRHGWAPITTLGAGNTFERTPGNRSRSMDEPLSTQQTTATSALATPPGFLVQTAHGTRIAELDEPHPTVCASDDRHALVLSNNFNNVPQPVSDPLSSVTTGNRHGLIVSMRNHGEATAIEDPVNTVSAGGNHHALLMRNNQCRGDQGCMVTPIDEPARTMTTAGHQSLLIPNHSGQPARTLDQPMPTATTTATLGLAQLAYLVDDCGFRMLEPYEVAAAMAFPEHYIPRDLPKKEQVKLAGNAVTPPVMFEIVKRVVAALEAV